MDLPDPDHVQRVTGRDRLSFFFPGKIPVSDAADSSKHPLWSHVSLHESRLDCDPGVSRRTVVLFFSEKDRGHRHIMPVGIVLW